MFPFCLLSSRLALLYVHSVYAIYGKTEQAKTSNLVAMWQQCLISLSYSYRNEL